MKRPRLWQLLLPLAFGALVGACGGIRWKISKQRHRQPGDVAPPAKIRFDAPSGHARQEEHDRPGTARPVNGPVRLRLVTVMRPRLPASTTLLPSSLGCEAASIGRRDAVERPRCWNNKAPRLRRNDAWCVTDAPPVLAALERLAHLLELLKDAPDGSSLSGLEPPVDSTSSLQHEDWSVHHRFAYQIAALGDGSHELIQIAAYCRRVHRPNSENGASRPEPRASGHLYGPRLGSKKPGGFLLT